MIQGPLASLLDTIGIDVFEVLVCASLEDLVTVPMFFVLVSQCCLLQVLFCRVRMRSKCVCRGLRFFAQLRHTFFD